MARNSEWVVTANGAGYRIFSQDKKFSPLVEVSRTDWPSGRIPARDINSDRPGRTFDSGGQGRHAMEPPTDAHAEEEVRLAREIARSLQTAVQQQEFEQLTIIAGPRLLGHLRDTLPAEVVRHVVREIDKDLTAYSPDELTRWLRREVWEK